MPSILGSTGAPEKCETVLRESPYEALPSILARGPLGSGLKRLDPFTHPVTATNGYRSPHWGQFEYDLQRMKSFGVVAFATDVWWGLVETKDQVFDWSYYDKLSDTIINAGLQWIPILSTHQCGAPNDPACYYPVPAWTGITSNPNNGFQDIFGNVNYESFSPWSGDYVYQQYDELFAAFAEHYLPKKASIARIDLSGGTSGELRYPSYSINWNYPARGQIQAYSAGAVQDFRKFVLEKYWFAFVAGWNWGQHIWNHEQILPPCSTTNQTVTGVCAGKTGKDTFFSTPSKYQRDFGEWYQSVLIRHSKRISDSAHRRLDKFGAQIAMKMSGVHWQYFNPTEAHSAERAVGYWDYHKFLSALKKQNLQVTFTAIEMNDNKQDPYYSGAKTLVNQVFATCVQVGVKCGAENALDIGWADQTGFTNMREALTKYPVESLTFLRYQDLLNIGAGQFYASFVSAVLQSDRAVWFGVTGIPTSFGQSIAIVGSDPQLGSGDVSKALPLTAISCAGSSCIWSGFIKAKAPKLDFRVVVTGSSQIQCNATLLDLGKPMTNVWVNGPDLSTPVSDDIQVIRANATLCG
ncbi:thermophilic beta-amylase [Gorgonomyces haynaldii]|nr:thermophilic beta-amylase [Gorgonomyces haynaldii]